MTAPDIIAAVVPVVDAFERFGIPYSVGGSIASSAHGLARATMDVDLVADIRRDQVDGLVAELEVRYYIDAEVIVDAISRRTMFNLVHLATMLKVDVYLLGERPFDRESFRRRGPLGIPGVESDTKLYFATPEDVVLHKLEWFRLGGEVSERQWGDVVGVLRVQAGALDLTYLHEWGAQLGVADLLERALGEADGSTA